MVTIQSRTYLVFSYETQRKRTDGHRRPDFHRAETPGAYTTPPCNNAGIHQPLLPFQRRAWEEKAELEHALRALRDIRSGTRILFDRTLTGHGVHALAMAIRVPKTQLNIYSIDFSDSTMFTRASLPLMVNITSTVNSTVKANERTKLIGSITRANIMLAVSAASAM